MREIKFRGRTWEGEWVYGSFIDAGSAAFIWNRQPIKVNPETVGQYTGFKDRNGREIYEGDILKFEKSNVFWVVEWVEDRFWAVNKSLAMGDPLSLVHRNAEVIGNIYENHELLEDSNETQDHP